MKHSDLELESAILKSGFKVAAVSCILISGEQLLLIKRKKAPHKGFYCPVGGKIDPFESPQQAVVREVKEETGLEIQEPILRGMMVETSPADYNWISFIFSRSVEWCEPPNSDEGELEWIHKEELETIPIPQTDLHIYQKVLTKKFFYLDVHFDKNLTIVSMTDKWKEPGD